MTYAEVEVLRFLAEKAADRVIAAEDEYLSQRKVEAVVDHMESVVRARLSRSVALGAVHVRVLPNDDGGPDHIVGLVVDHGRDGSILIECGDRRYVVRNYIAATCVVGSRVGAKRLPDGSYLLVSCSCS